MSRPEVSQVASTTAPSSSIAWFGDVTPDILVPSQTRKPTPFEQMPEYALLWSLLNDAVACALLMIGSIGGTEDAEAVKLKRWEQQDEAMRWIESTDTEWFFSFENVCSLLKQNASWLRGHVLREARALREAGLSQNPRGGFGRTKSTGGGIRTTVVETRKHRPRSKEQRARYARDKAERQKKRRENLTW